MQDAYIYRDRPGDAGGSVIFAFHGTGGDENQFFDLAGDLVPGGRVISPRGDVSELGAARFFRRTGEGVYDMADLARAVAQMAGFVTAHSTGAHRVIGLGYSNGANILSALSLSYPDLFDDMVLMHPLIPWAPDPVPGLNGKNVLITAGRLDPIGPAPSTQRLADFYVSQGAKTALVWHDGGHELRPTEIEAAREFLSSVAA
jgi:phospholipase/carboxylesterase